MKKKIEFSKYLYELLVVFIGVTAAFLLSNWAESRKNVNLESIYINHLVEEFNSNKALLERIVEYNREKTVKINRLIELLESKIFVDSINVLSLDCLLKNVYYEPETNTWESLKASGDLKLINEYELLIMLNELHSSYKEAEYSQRLLDEFVTGKVFDFTLVNFNLKDFRFYDSKNAFTPFYLNLIIGYQALLQGYIYKLNHTQEVIDKISALIDDKSR